MDPMLLQVPWPYAPLWDMVADTTGVDVGAAATTVTLSALGGWVVLRVFKFLAGRLEAEEARLKSQESEVVALRQQVTALQVDIAKCHAERDSNREALARAGHRIETLETRMGPPHE